MAFELPMISGALASILMWMNISAVQGTTEIPNGVNELANYGFAGVIVALVVWGLQYFNKRADAQEQRQEHEIESYKKELADERADRRNQEVAYQAQIRLLQEEILQLKTAYARLEVELQNLKRERGWD